MDKPSVTVYLENLFKNCVFMEVRIRRHLQEGLDSKDAEAIRNVVVTEILGKRESFDDKPMPSPSLLVVAAESCIQVALINEAETCLNRFHLYEPRPDQFLCRALLSQALIINHRSKGLKQQFYVDRINSAIQLVLKALSIAQQQKSYSFLICTCSTVYWTVARGLLRPTKWKHSTSSLQAILDGLTKHCRDIVSKEWLFELSFALAVGFDDSGDSAGSVKIANDCLALAKDLSRQFQIRATRLAVHVNRAKGAVPSIAFTATGIKAIVILQSIQSGMIKPEQILAKLTEAFQIADQNMSVAPKRLDLDKLDVVAEIGRVAWRFGQADLAKKCIERTQPCKNFVGLQRSWILADMTASEMAVFDSENHQHAVSISSRLDALKLVEPALAAAERLMDADLVQDACMTVWNLSCPMLGDEHRLRLLPVFRRCTDAMKRMDLSCLELRTLFHFELARCELLSGAINKARIEVNAANDLDYAIPVERLDAESRSSPSVDRLCRPYDVHISILQKKLTAGMPDASTPRDDFALILAQRSCEIRDSVSRCKLLSRAIRKLSRAPTPNSDAVAAAELRFFIWAELMEHCLTNVLSDLALICIDHLVSHTTTNPDRQVLQCKAYLAKAGILIDQNGDQPALYQRPVDAILEPDAAAHAAGHLYALAPWADPVLDACLSALVLGSTLQKQWVVRSAIVFVWNAIQNVVRRHLFDDQAVTLDAKLVSFLAKAYETVSSPTFRDNEVKHHLALILARSYEATQDLPATKDICLKMIEPLASAADAKPFLQILERVSPGFVLPKSVTLGKEADLAQAILLVQRTRCLPKENTDGRAASALQAQEALEKVAAQPWPPSSVDVIADLMVSISEQAVDMNQPALLQALCQLGATDIFRSESGRCMAAVAGLEQNAALGLIPTLKLEGDDRDDVIGRVAEHLLRANSSKRESILERSISIFYKLVMANGSYPDAGFRSQLETSLTSVLESLPTELLLKNPGKVIPEIRSHLYRLKVHCLIDHGALQQAFDVATAYVKLVPDYESKPIAEVQWMCAEALQLDTQKHRLINPRFITYRKVR